MNIDEQINRENGVHGHPWNSLHEGYFSDAAVARPFVSTIIRYLSDTDTDVMVDLGGGTGFILKELIEKVATTNIIPINLDCSSTQLDAMGKSGISCIRGLISDFRRSDLVPTGRKIFFMMRSVLHYFGREGQTAILQHIRNQAREGEMFIHQSACFEKAEEANCLNALYREMGSPKWYPVIHELRDTMAVTNWGVMDIVNAPPLKLSSVELGQRYGLEEQDLRKIRKKLMEKFGNIENVFHLDRNGFTAYLHYRICVTRAVEQAL